MKIAVVNDEGITFDNGYIITYGHVQDCCECNYADFEQIEDIAKTYDFDEDDMKFEEVTDSGFRFGDSRRMFFIPCYSCQNGYYSSDVDIYYNDKRVLNIDAEVIEE